MTSTQLDIFSGLAEAPASGSGPSGEQHRRILVALYNEGARGLVAEECAQRCGMRASHIAATRLIEMSAGHDERFPIPLVARSEKKDRPTASGRNAFRWFLTDVGRGVASDLLKEAA